MTPATQYHDKLNLNYLNLRRYLGILGIALPILLVAGNQWTVEPSISHYYYTEMTVVFTSVLFAFGLLLMSYSGYEREENEIVSDNVITNIAGVLAIVVAVIPTAGLNHQSGMPNWHQDETLNLIHLISAGLFIVLMGFMSFHQFSKEMSSIKSNSFSAGDTESNVKKRVFLYRLSGLVIWGVVLFLLLEMLLGFQITDQDTFWGESIALLFFGISWLTKSKSLRFMGM